jgi:hypothetical protein
MCWALCDHHPATSEAERDKGPKIENDAKRKSHFQIRIKENPM